MRWQFFAVALMSCAHPTGRATTTNADSPTSRASAEIRFVSTDRSSQVTCPDAAMKVDGTWLCPDEAKAQGLTILDLNDAWTPKLLSGEGDIVPVFRDKYLALAQDRSLDGKPLPHEDEHFGTVQVYRDRLVVQLPFTKDAKGAVSIKVVYQGCADAGLCYPPQTRTLEAGT